MPTPLPSFLAMHHFDAPPRISAAQPEDVAIKDRGASSERDEQFDLLEVRSCGSIDEKSESDADEFKDLSPEKTSEMAEKIEQVSDPTEKLNLSPEHKAKDAMKPLQTQVERQDTAKFGETQRELFPRTEAETKQEDDILFDKLEEKLLPESLDKQAAMPALMLSRLPGPGRPEEEKAEAAPELLDMLSKVSAQVATLQSELASLRASMDSLHEEFQELRVERPTAKPSSAVEEQLAELKSSVKRELHDVQEVLNSELKDLTSLFRGEMQQLSDKVQALDAADTQLLQNINALTLDCAALQGAFEETRPAVANLAHAQSALGSAQREKEKQLNASILRQKSDALALNARVMEMEGGWTGLFGCYCKRRRPREAAKPELSSQLDPQQIPSDAERPRGQSVTLDDD